MRSPSHLYCALLSVAACILFNCDALPEDKPDLHIIEGLNKVIKKSYTAVKTPRVTKLIFKGGCAERPLSPINGHVTCSSDSGCRANCIFNYKFPNGEEQLAITCVDGKWTIPGTDWTSIPHCEPICLPQCQNNGICVSPNECHCSEAFSGPQCQFENKPCLNYPTPVLNSRRHCNSKSCTVTCLDDFVFPNGVGITNIICKNGIWQPTNPDWVSVPDCQPVCSPPCQNGGNCLPLNTCQCPQEFTGPQCQYLSSACTPEKLGFNGGYKCIGQADSYSCTLNCPPGIDFTAPPALEYICTYDKGYFEPNPIPQCVIDESHRIIPVESSHNSYFKMTNHTWSIEDVYRSNAPTSLESQYAGTYYESDEQNFRKGIKVGSVKGGSIKGGSVKGGSIKGGKTSLTIAPIRPEPKTCFTWGGVHYKTFDGAIYSFDSTCSYTLIQETRDNSFTVTVQNNPDCNVGKLCSRILKIFILEKEYSLQVNEDGFATFRNTKKVLPIPIQLTGLRVEMTANFVVVILDSIGVTLKWDGKLLVQIEASVSLWNRTTGLCGRMNGNAEDDLIEKDGRRTKHVGSITASWRVERIGEKCDELVKTKHSCDSNNRFRQDAEYFCLELLGDPRFRSCSGIIDRSLLEKACQWDYCACKENDKRECACHTLNVYVKQCAHQKIVSSVGWRRNDTCPITCTYGRIYMACGPKSQATCSSDSTTKASDDLSCEEGCFCPEGTVLHDNKCIALDECPCKLRGRIFQPGEKLPKGCNTCTCLSGKWVCTQTWCSSRCAAVGDPHYVTFDGKHYDFMGKCNYYLLKGDNYSIETENEACSGAISESMGLEVSLSDKPSCTKSVTIRLGSDAIKLKQNHQVLVNGEDVAKLPINVAGMKLRIASSIFLIANLPNGLEIWWDSVSRIYINAPAEFRGRTSGLCGTFNANQKDDFLTPDGDVEKSAVPFANKWKTAEQCSDIETEEFNHPCDANPQKREAAKKYCSHLWAQLFSECHWHVDPEPFYKDCMFDMCACETKVELCLCPTIAAYAAECANIGVKVLWRPEIEECKIHCPRDQEYQICGNSCARSCGDISFHEDCKHECVEGCNCPEGQTLNLYDECIPIGQCPCFHAGQEFKAGYREIRPGRKSQELCTCAGARWNCLPATPQDILKYPAAGNLENQCSPGKNLKISNCLPMETRTCRNMHESVTQSPAICKVGCVCKDGYVKDSPSGSCVKERECPCYHGGKSYKETSVVQDDCNTCKCESGKWNCTDRPCAGVCSAWGDSHYKTFDGRLYEFQGVCDYILAKAHLSDDEVFEVSTQNVPCGSSGVSCSKAITFKVGNGKTEESMTLTRGKPIQKVHLKRIAVRKVGLFVFLDCPDLGIVVQWDEGTRVYVKVHPKWRGHTKGLCGDYNDNSDDDYKSPSGGISEVSPRLFGDSWKKQDYCAEPKDIVDTCTIHPERKSWAVEKCGILKTSVFQPCHSEVAVEPYLQNCIFDTCGCDSGGDCECLCTALAAYAQECNMKGIPVKWRTQELCPIQCDVSCSSYSPCISACPLETCDNMVTLNSVSHLCAEDACVEGCLPKSCPENEIYKNETFAECVPKETCKPFCLNVNGTNYYEGDQVRGDDCQSCFCSRGKILCNGAPCTSTVTPATSREMMEAREKCVDGWSTWINKHSTIKGKKTSDTESLPTVLELLQMPGSAVCTKEEMIDIQCRSVKDHKTSKETGLNAECSLERGLYCRPEPHGEPCVDFEIRVLCQCKQSTRPTTYLLTTSRPPTSVVSTVLPMNEQCDTTHPNKAHPTDCRIFYQCAPTLNGLELIEKTCGPTMMYNPISQVCDWPGIVFSIRPECMFSDTTKVTITTQAPTTQDVLGQTSNLCHWTQFWSDCAIPCSQTCEFFHNKLQKEGLCTNRDHCIPGCVTYGQSCSRPALWRDEHTCVEISGCTCKSKNGTSVKPNVIFKESDCESCQCIDNYYTCDKSHCATSTSSPPHTTVPSTVRPVTDIPTRTTVYIEDYTMMVTSSLSPAEKCLSKDFVPLRASSLGSKMSFSGSTTKNKMNGAFPNEWQPMISDTEQWLGIYLPHAEPIYGLIVQGSNSEDKYVTSYKVLFSEDGSTYSHVLNDKKSPRIFRGPADRSTPVQQIFDVPFEAKIIKINPQTWHNGIAMRIDVLGCNDHFTISTHPPTSTTPIPLTTTDSRIFLTTSTQSPMHTEQTKIPVCNDRMGLDSGSMAEEQISASSVRQSSLSNLRPSSKGLWRPRLDNPHQYVQFDFLEPRELTGIETKGSDNIWTSAYKIFYSMDGRDWNPVIDSSGSEKEFLGNYDDVSSRTNYFDRPIRARYLKINPIKWHKHVGLKVEVFGCFSPYPTPTTESISTTKSGPMKIIVPSVENLPPQKQRCNVCDGITNVLKKDCTCKDQFWWNGETCVTKPECPCVVGSITYAVGAMFETDDCKQCVCNLGGEATCQPKKCPPCNDPHLQSVITELCSCSCKPCSPGTRLCPTSKICINETLWCNGIQDCPDDESDCQSGKLIKPSPTTHLISGSTTKIDVTTITTLNVTQTLCEKPVCPPGYKIAANRPTYTNTKSTKTPSRFGGLKSPTKTSSKRWPKTHNPRAQSLENQPMKDEKTKSAETECPKFSCIPLNLPVIDRPGVQKCPKAQCPPGYKVTFVKLSTQKLVSCPKYTCTPPTPIEVVCNVTGRTFNTFDKLEYKYDICSHILARYRDDNKWYITLEKHCSVRYPRCIQVLSIAIDDDDVILYPDMRVDIGDHGYTAHQVKRLGDIRGSFGISRVGDILYFVSRKYGFWVIWDKNSNVKIGLTTKLAYHVDGLCGYFDGDVENDRQKPDGTPAKSTLDFGNSWAMDDAPQCEPQVCPLELQQQAREICGTVKDTTLSAFSAIIDLDKFISCCMETACTCMNGNATTEDCRCRALLSFFTEVQAADQNSDISNWRTIYNCPVHCPAPLVHNDCFRKKCEISCSNLRDTEACPVMPGVCFSGCFCPDGTVRNGDECIPASECRDCVCNGFGSDKFISYDKSNFTFLGNCTYVLSRDVNKDKIIDNKNHTYEVLMTNVPCYKGVCTESITVLYEQHVIEVRKGNAVAQLETLVDGNPVNDSPLRNDWLNLQDRQGQYLTVLIPGIQLEVTIFHHNFAFTIKIPSSTFGGAMEGLCGNCNGIIEDDLKTKEEVIVNDVNAFGMSWLTTNRHESQGTKDLYCSPKTPKKCNEATAELSVCDILENAEPFGQCHGLVDPVTFVDSCKEAVCENGDVCNILEAYARSCLQAGLCLDWRTAAKCPYECPSHLEYQSCASGCKTTCDGILKDESCSLEQNEGCYCPEHHVFYSNGTCIPERNCLICDEEGHVEGDKWNIDKCTACSCANKTVTCRKTDCPVLSTICEDKYTPVLVASSEDDCCQKYSCVPQPTTAHPCLEPQQPECGFGQMTKLIIDDDGCRRFICECVPTEACPPLEFKLDVRFSEAGYVEVTNTSGCCPKLSKICKPETCPGPPLCPEYHVVSSNHHPQSCCPNYECKLSPDVCLYKPQSDNNSPNYQSNGIAKKIGEVWKDGDCKTCTCKLSGDTPVANCLVTECLDHRTTTEFSEFVMEKTIVPGSCCPVFKRKACKQAERIYYPGDKWHPNSADICTMVECVNMTGEIEKKTTTQTCNINCEEGFEYVASKNTSVSCCGECIGVSCVVDQIHRSIGEEWKSDDHCVTYECLRKNTGTLVRGKTMTCPEIDALEKERYKLEQVLHPGQCCKEIVRIGCLYDGVTYKAGEKWRLKNNACITEFCNESPEGVTVQQETKICNTMCPKGWKYVEPTNGECCGECKQTHCTVGEDLYKPGAVWHSNNNCTTMTCMEQSNQLVVSSSSAVCPDLTDCPERGIYFDGCCRRCNLTELNLSQPRACLAEVMDMGATVGLLREKHGKHGMCRNLDGIKGITECRGNCSSSTRFDTESWKQIYECECCQPRDMQTIPVKLTCDDGKIYEKKITVPSSCSCETCGSHKVTKGGHTNVKG